MRLCTLALASLVLVSCGPAADAPDDAELAETPESAPVVTLDAYAGTWQNVVTLEGVEDPVVTTMRATATPAGWTMELEGREPVALTPAIVGDSLVVTSAPYESILRPGVTTTVRTATVIEGGQQVGNVVVTYQTAQGEEVVRGTLNGTRLP
jgi:hypothetical protein